LCSSFEVTVFFGDHGEEDPGQVSLGKVWKGLSDLGLGKLRLLLHLLDMGLDGLSIGPHWLLDIDLGLWDLSVELRLQVHLVVAEQRLRTHDWLLELVGGLVVQQRLLIDLNQLWWLVSWSCLLEDLLLDLLDSILGSLHLFLLSEELGDLL
jgi:hypothetical protein